MGVAIGLRAKGTRQPNFESFLQKFKREAYGDTPEDLRWL